MKLKTTYNIILNTKDCDTRNFIMDKKLPELYFIIYKTGDVSVNVILKDEIK